MSLSYIAEQIIIYVGFFLVVTGVIGNGINIFIFSSVRNYRTTPCTFYFLISSIVNFACVTINLISRIVITGFEIDLSKTSTSWCKIRQCLLYALPMITVYCSCLATVDQFFVTSQSANLRRLSNIKWTHRIVFILIIMGFLQSIPFLLFYNISAITSMCVNTNTNFGIYIPIYFLILFFAVPIIVTVSFGYLTYRNIQLTRVLAEQQADRQLVRMTLIQVVVLLIGFLPGAIINTYSLITSKVSKDTNQLMIENFANIMITIMLYFYYAGSCYMFLISSSRFRRAIKDRLFFCFRPTQVIPLQQRVGKTTVVKQRTTT